MSWNLLGCESGGQMSSENNREYSWQKWPETLAGYTLEKIQLQGADCTKTFPEIYRVS